MTEKMTANGQRLLAYVKSQLGRKKDSVQSKTQQAEAWLDTHLPEWRQSTLPRTKRVVVTVSAEDDDE